MKRKFTLAFMALTATMMSVAHAGGFKTLVLKSANGESYSVAAQGLEIYYNDGNLTFNNDKRSFPVASLLTMEFSDNPGNSSAVTGILPDSAAHVAVFTLDGINAGEFASLPEACKSLAPGMYVVRLSNGQTAKFMVEK